MRKSLFKGIRGFAIEADIGKICAGSCSVLAKTLLCCNWPMHTPGYKYCIWVQKVVSPEGRSRLLESGLPVPAVFGHGICCNKVNHSALGPIAFLIVCTAGVI